MGNVLVVDDNEDICRAVMRMIRMIGARADCVLGGTAALRYLEHNATDLVMLDYMMPDLDGLSVLRRLRDDPRTRALPVLLFTAGPADEVRVQAEALGARGVLQKAQIGFDTLRPWIEPLVERPGAPA